MNLNVDKRALIGVGVGLVILLAVIPGIYFYNKYKGAVVESGNTADEATELVAKVGRHMQLPEGENPTIATITDIEKLRDQPFFARAKNGDKLLVYRGARKAILYDPVADRIIDVAPLNFAEEATNSGQLLGTEAVATESGEVAALVRVGILNGTAITGLTRTIETQVKERLDQIEVVLRGNSKQVQSSTVVVDLSGNQSQVASQLAQVVRGRVGALPTGEDRPDGVDVLVILGGDQVVSPSPIVSPGVTP